MRHGILGTALVAVLALGLAACGDDKGTETANGGGGASDPTPAKAAPGLGDGTWTGGDAPDLSTGITAVAFFHPG